MVKFGTAVVAVISLTGVILGYEVRIAQAASAAVTAQAQAAPGEIVVSPDADLVDGQVVTVAGTGWAPDHEIGFCQAVAVDPPGPDNCDDGQYMSVTADGAGDWSGALTVARVIDVPSLGASVDCASPATPCVVGAADGADVAGTVVSVPLAFAPAAPLAPAPVSAVAGSLSATVTWAVPFDGGSAITGYTVFVGIPGSYFPERVVNVGPTDTTLTVTGLTAGSEHFFRVAAINSVGTGPYARSPGRITIGP